MTRKAKGVRSLSAEEVAALNYAPPTAKKNRPIAPKYFERDCQSVPQFRSKRRAGMK